MVTVNVSTTQLPQATATSADDNLLPAGILPVSDLAIDGTDAIWVLLTAYFVFTMQSG